jgi:RNA polymerase sigma-70 factor (ECF subfamily)
VKSNAGFVVQIQEKMTAEIVNSLERCCGRMVWQSCMSSRGVHKSEATLVTTHIRTISRTTENPVTNSFQRAILALRPETFPSVAHPIGEPSKAQTMSARAPIPIRDLDAKNTETRSPGTPEGRWCLSHHYAATQPSPLSVRPIHYARRSKVDDIVQEAYGNAISNLAGFRGESGLGTWLTRITLNEALERFRRRRPTVELATLASAEPNKARIIASPLMTLNSDPERTAAQREIRRLVERAIDDLPELFRVVFVMREIEDMSVEETAGFLGLRPAMVKYRLHRARRLLRKMLDAQLVPALTDAFPFDGMRCARMTGAILQRFGL